MTARTLPDAVPTALELYVRSFVVRHGGGARPAPEAPSYGGLIGSSVPPARLLVTDDRAVDELAALLATDANGTITVLAAAARSMRLLADHAAWAASAVTAMVSRDLRAVPDLALPPGLSLRPVRRLDTDACDGGDLAEAVRLAGLDAAGSTALATHLRSLPPTTGLLAAVDDDDAIRATAGFRVSGAEAAVFFVNTDPARRRRGVGSAMTAAALRAACAAGAERAALDASAVAVGVYRRLGFEVAAHAVQFHRAR